MADKSANIIHLNGKQYDARTGELIAKNMPAFTQPAKTQTKKLTPASTKKVITVSKLAHRSNSVVTAVKPQATTAPAIATKKRPAHTPAPSLRKRTPQRPQTLMRHTVHKPVAQKSPIVKVQTLAHNTPSTMVVKPKVSVQGIHAKRAQQALVVPKSAAVSRFSKPAPLPQNPKPVAKIAPLHSTQAAKNALFEKALANSKSHEAVHTSQKTKKKKSSLRQSFRKQRSVFAVAATVSVLVVVGASIAVTNMPAIELQVANIRAGMQASLPKYQPDGFSKNGPVAYQSGKVTVSFRANDNSNRAYNVVQEESDWNSETLLDSVVAVNNQRYQTVEQNGKTIYLYGNSQATWVSGGMRYSVTGNANLPTDQILDIANSI